MTRSTHKHHPVSRRSTFLYDLVLEDEFDEGAHEDRMYVQEFTEKFSDKKFTND